MVKAFGNKLKDNVVKPMMNEHKCFATGFTFFVLSIKFKNKLFILGHIMYVIYL